MSPIQELREEWGLSITQFAAALGIGYNQAHQTERGRQRLPRKGWAALREIGVDVGDLERRQSAWFEDRASRLRAEIKARVGVSA